MKRYKLFRTIRFISILSLILLFFIIVIVQYIVQYREFNIQSNIMRAEYINRQKNMIKREVDRVVERIKYLKKTSYDKAKHLVKQRVYEAFDITQNLYKQYSDKMTEQQVQALIKNSLEPIRFNNGNGYYFIISFDGHIEMLPYQILKGKNFSNSIGKLEQKTAEDLVNSAKHLAEGYYTYNWTKPSVLNEKFTKVSYYKTFKPYNWIIGTGIYVDDIDEISKKDILQEVSRMKYGENGYLFIDNWNGLVLTHGNQPDLIGTNIWEHEDANGVKVVQKLIAAAKTDDGDFIYYSWIKPDTGQERPKISFARGIKSWKWMIGTGVYIDDIESEISNLNKQMYRELRLQTFVFLLITLAVIILLLIIFYILNNKLLYDFQLFRRFFRNAAADDIEINRDLIRFDEFYSIAGDANQMLKDKKNAQSIAEKEREQLDVTLQSIEDGVIATNKNGYITLLNVAAETMLGVSKGKCLGKTLKSVFPLKSKKFSMFVDSTLTHGNSTSSDEVEAILYNSEKNTEFMINFSISSIKNPKDEILGVVLTFRDISEKIRREKENEQLRRLESVGILAGGIAHDFNNILTVILGNVELAKHYLYSDISKTSKFLNSLVSPLENAKQLSFQLLTFAKGGKPIKSIIRIGDEIVKSASFALRGSNVKLQLQISNELWPVNVDLGQINQVVTNLILNAKQAMPEGGIVKIIADNIVDKGRQTVKIIFADTGCGISEEHLSRIFEPYFTTKRTGNGLGLASSFSIIKRHKGKIQVSSKLGKGSIFTILLPACNKKISKMDYLKESGNDREMLFLKETHILVVDDEKEIRETLKEMLLSIGANVMSASEGKEALNKYKNGAFDLVITDLTFPGGIGGDKIAEEILKINKDAKIIVSSGYATNSVMSEYSKYGFANCILKPFTFNELKKVLQRVLN